MLVLELELLEPQSSEDLTTVPVISETTLANFGSQAN